MGWEGKETLHVQSNGASVRHKHPSDGAKNCSSQDEEPPKKHPTADIAITFHFIQNSYEPYRIVPTP